MIGHLVVGERLVQRCSVNITPCVRVKLHLPTQLPQCHPGRQVKNRMHAEIEMYRRAHARQIQNVDEESMQTRGRGW